MNDGPEDKRRIMKSLASLYALRSALEIYKQDHDGRFPEALIDLVPRYLSSIPQPDLPGGGIWKYSGVSGSGDYGKLSVDSVLEYKGNKLADY